ncbi:hypothetical protein BC833DRAFT_561541 [Globomyces pollinis-pini]|nr:hypothetical protein BC833DRAFT_561541 [Globomyces pollinis-pini]
MVKAKALKDRKVDFLIVGLGSPKKEHVVSRQNVGSIFADYLANCISMQALLLKQGEVQDPVNPVIPPDFKRPAFIRRRDLLSDIHDSEFALTEADVYTGPEDEVPEGADAKVHKIYRVVIAKSLSPLQTCGPVVKKLVEEYKIKDIAKQLIVVLDNNKANNKGFEGHAAEQNVIDCLGTNDFIRFRLGVGKPNAKYPIEKHGLRGFNDVPGDVDLVGHSLDITGQALQNYTAFLDVSQTKEKFDSTKKPTKELRQLPGLLFPVDITDPEEKMSKTEKAAIEKKNSAMKLLIREQLQAKVEQARLKA